MSVKVEVAIKHAASGLGEGPHWEDNSKSLLYIDAIKGVVSRWNSETNENKSITLGGKVGFIVPCRQNGYLVAHNKSFVHLDWDNESTTKIAEVDKDIENNALNDGKCDAAGRIIAGTWDAGKVPATVLPEMGSLYQLGKDKSVKTLLKKVTISNGLAWTSDNKTMFYIDSVPRKVFAFDYDMSTGDISNQRVAVGFEEGTEETIGYPDGMAIDTENKIWVACYGVGKVIRFDPETGKQLQTIEIPTSLATSCCFGGENLDELYITCGRSVLNEQQLAEQPLAGSVFKATGLGVKGVVANVFDGL